MEGHWFGRRYLPLPTIYDTRTVPRWDRRVDILLYHTVAVLQLHALNAAMRRICLPFSYNLPAIISYHRRATCSARLYYVRMTLIIAGAFFTGHYRYESGARRARYMTFFSARNAYDINRLAPIISDISRRRPP